MSLEGIVRLEHPSAKAFLTLFDVLGNIVDETLVKFTDKGMFVKALDPAKVALIEIEVPVEAFLDYRIEKELEIGVNLSSLLKILPKPKKGDKLILNANEEFYEIIIQGTTTKRYKLRSIEVSASEVPEINLEFNVKAIVLAQAFKSALKDLKGVESIEFSIEDEQNIYLRSADGGVSAKLSAEGGSVLSIELKEPSKNVYDEDYIMKVLDLAGIAESLEIQFGSELPLYLSFTVVDGGIVRYLLAPKA